MNTDKPTDLRIIKTKEAMHQALITLLKEKPYEQISAKDVIEKARVNRTTFYRYYSGLVSLVDEIIGQFKQEFADILNAHFSQTEQALQAIFAKRDIIAALWKIQSRRYQLYDDMHQMIRTAFADEQVKRKIKSHNPHHQAFLYASLCMESLRYVITYDEFVPFASASEDLIEIVKLLGQYNRSSPSKK